MYKILSSLMSSSSSSSAKLPLLRPQKANRSLRFNNCITLSTWCISLSSFSLYVFELPKLKEISHDHSTRILTSCFEACEAFPPSLPWEENLVLQKIRRDYWIMNQSTYCHQNWHSSLLMILFMKSNII